MPTVPQVPAVTTGIYTSSQLSALATATNFNARPPRAQLLQTVVQTLTTAVAAPITFTTEIIDTDYLGGSGHDNVTNPSRYTANFPGLYLLGGGAAFAANATGRRACWWQVNGIAVNGSSVAGPAAIGGLETVVSAREIEVFLNVGDYVELMGYQESGGNLNTFSSTFNASSMSVLWVSN